MPKTQFISYLATHCYSTMFRLLRSLGPQPAWSDRFSVIFQD